MAATPLDDRLRKRAHELASELCGMLPTRVWVEGDGKMYGDFSGNGAQRRRLTELDVVRLLHAANEKSNQILSAL